LKDTVPLEERMNTKRPTIVATTAVALGALAGLLYNYGWHAGPTAGSQPGHRTMPGGEMGAREKGAKAVSPMPPRIKIATGEEVPTSPSDPRYDPTALTLAGYKAPQIFEAEPRDPIWAPQVERRLSSQFSSDLSVMVPLAHMTNLTCHTATCRLDFDAPKEGGQAVVRALQLAPAADTVTFDLRDHAGVLSGSMFLSFGENREPRKQEEVFGFARRDALARLKPGQGRLAGISKLPEK
jgi:hypothetical protein